MQGRIYVDRQEISYTLRKSDRARRLRITVDQNNGVVVTLPRRGSVSAAEDFLIQKARWILRSIEYFSSLPKRAGPQRTYSDYLRNKERARAFAEQKIERFNEIYKFSVGRVSIKNQKSIWGSCSRKGNLNLNYKILFLPERAAEYIIVHELCHLKQPNHSAKFWDLVAQAVPEHKTVRAQLRNSRM